VIFFFLLLSEWILYTLHKNSLIFLIRLKWIALRPFRFQHKSYFFLAIWTWHITKINSLTFFEDLSWIGVFTDYIWNQFFPQSVNFSDVLLWSPSVYTILLLNLLIYRKIGACHICHSNTCPSKLTSCSRTGVRKQDCFIFFSSSWVIYQDYITYDILLENDNYI
jgi:hypothetical protein